MPYEFFVDDAADDEAVYEAALKIQPEYAESFLLAVAERYLRKGGKSNYVSAVNFSIERILRHAYYKRSDADYQRAKDIYEQFRVTPPARTRIEDSDEWRNLIKTAKTQLVDPTDENGDVNLSILAQPIALGALGGAVAGPVGLAVGTVLGASVWFARLVLKDAKDSKV